MMQSGRSLLRVWKNLILVACMLAKLNILTLNMEAVYLSEMLVNPYETTCNRTQIIALSVVILSSLLSYL
jgi:hypothetical protein